MAHTFVSNLLHCVFSTKAREKLIHRELQERLWPFIGGIARQNHFRALAIGGTKDHVHVLLSVPATIPVAKAVQLIQCGSSNLSGFVRHSHKGDISNGKKVTARSRLANHM